MRYGRRNTIYFVLPLVFILSSCAHEWGLRYPPSRWIVANDRQSILQPGKEVPFVYPLGATPGYTRQVEMLFELTARVAEIPAKALPGGETPALNVNNFDEIPDSAWFTNRVWRRDVALDELIRGPGNVVLPSAKAFKVTAMGDAAVTQWLAVQGNDGSEYIFSFDRQDRPTMATGAAFIVSRVLFAAGYNIPPGNIVAVDPKWFSLLPQATLRKPEGSVRVATKDDLEIFFRRTTREARSRLIRAYVIKKPDGIHLGSFSFSGRRHNSNDRISHQHRRELRGLDILCAWLDHRMVIDSHTADFFIPGADGRGFVKHYLIGFEGSLGNLSAALAHIDEPTHPQTKLKTTSMKFPPVTLYSRYELLPKREQPTPFDAASLSPYWWEPWVPNPALWNATKRDELWGAAILSRFTDDRIAAIVRAANVEPGVEANLLDVLGKRRDKLFNFWLERINPLGNFGASFKEGEAIISFEDIAFTAHVPDIKGSSYRWCLRTANARKMLIDWQISPHSVISLSKDVVDHMAIGRTYVIEIETLRPKSKWSTPSVNVFLKKKEDGIIELAGLARH